MANRYDVESFLRSILINSNVNVKADNPKSLVELAIKYADAVDAAFPVVQKIVGPVEVPNVEAAAPVAAALEA